MLAVYFYFCNHAGSGIKGICLLHVQINREGRVGPVLSEGGVLRGLERAGEAHALMESGAHIGKIVLVISTEGEG